MSLSNKRLEVEFLYMYGVDPDEIVYRLRDKYDDVSYEYVKEVCDMCESGDYLGENDL